MLPPAERRSEPVFVLLRPREKQALEDIAEAGGKSRGAVLRDAFLAQHPEVVGDATFD